MRQKGLHFLAVDLTDKAALLAVSAQLPERFVLIHMAARVSTHSSIDARGVDEINGAVTMTLNLINVLAGRIAYLCFISSVDVFGNPGGQMVEESHPVNSERVYGAAKLMSEHMFLVASQRYGFGLSILRVGHVYGPFEHVASVTHEGRGRRMIPSFIRSCLEHKPMIIFGDGQDLRDYVHSYDVAQAILRAVVGGAEGLFIIASGKSYSVIQIAEMIRKVTGCEQELEMRPRMVPRFDYRFSIAKAQNVLGYVPTVKMIDGLADEVLWTKRVASNG